MEPTVGSPNLVESGGVEAKISPLEKKTALLRILEDYGFYIADENGDVGFAVVNGILDALGFGENITEIIKALIGDNVDFTPIYEAISNLRDTLESADAAIKEQIKYFATTDDRGLCITDEEGNIAWYFKPFVTDEGGVYFTDEEGNIGFSIIDGKFDFSNFGDNIQAVIGEKVSEDKTIVENYKNINKNIAYLEKLKAEVEDSVETLVTLVDTNADVVTKTVTVPASTTDTPVAHSLVRLGLHYGSCNVELGAKNNNIAIWDEVYFDGKCRKDFSDVRVFDGDGNMLPFYMLHHGNYEVCKDNNFIYTTYILKDANNAFYSKNLVTYDYGQTWTALFANEANYTCYFFDVDYNLYLYTKKDNTDIVESKKGDIIKVPLVNGEYDFSQAAVVCHVWYYNYYYHAVISISGTALAAGTLVLQATPSSGTVKRYDIPVAVGDTASDICQKIAKLTLSGWTATQNNNTVTLDSTECKIYIEPELTGSVNGIITSVTVTKDGAEAYYPPIIHGRNLAYESNGHKYAFTTSYQEPVNVLILRSVDGGAWTECVNNQKKYEITGRNAQHVHMMSYDHVHKILYAGLDNALDLEYGPSVIKSYDNGDTWEDVNFTDEEIATDKNAYLWWFDRSRDMGPSFFSDDGTFSIVGGETNILGGFTVLRVDNTDAANDVTKTDKKFEVVVNNGCGTRMYAVNSLGDDFVVVPIIAGASHTTAQLILSTDKGKTWKTIWHQEDPLSAPNAGNGPRSSVRFTANGEDQIVVGGQSEMDKYSPLRVFRGGEHYYAEILVDVGELPATGKVLTVSSGYAMKYPNKKPFSRDLVAPLYSIDFNEGIGRSVTDSEGNIGTIVGDYEWVEQEFGFGYLIPAITEYGKHYGLRLGAGSYINFGKIGKLNFKNGFTIVVFMNEVSRGTYDVERIKGLYYNYCPIISWGNLHIYRNNAGIRIGTKTANSYSSQTNGTVNSDYIKTCAIRISPSEDESANPEVNVRFSDEPFGVTSSKTNATLEWTNLSENDLIIGTSNNDVTSGGECNDTRRIIYGIRIYDSELTDADIDAITFGYNRRLERNY